MVFFRDSLDGLGGGASAGSVVKVSAVICSWDSHMTFAGSTSEMEPRRPQKNECLVPLVLPCLTLFTVLRYSSVSPPPPLPSPQSLLPSFLRVTHSSSTKALSSPQTLLPSPPPLCLILSLSQLPETNDACSCWSCWCTRY